MSNQRPTLPAPDSATASSSTARVDPPASRNAPCPCGSGKRYKECHGSVVAAPAASATAGDSASLLARGGAAHRRNDLDTAERAYRDVLALEPGHATAMHYLGMVHYQRGQPEAALPLLDHAAGLAPGNAEFHSNRGIALGAMQRDREAINAFRQALALAPDHAGAWNNLGLALQADGQVDDAVAAFRRSLDLAPDSPQAHWNLALALLLLGEFDEGFREYEWRLRAPELAPFLRTHAGTRWDGSDPMGMTLLVTAEQGLGDTLQNIRFASTLADRGAKVVAAVQPVLKSLVATVPGVAMVIDADEASPPSCDATIPLMSLPGMLGLAAAERSASPRYLTPDPRRLEEARRAVAAAAPAALRVGLAWSGAPGNPYNRRRACPLHSFDPLFKVAGVCWFSLQREGEAIAAADAAAAARLVCLPLRNDFAGTAALVDALDLVISVDTSLLHLAGALGKPVWALLPLSPDWRWRLECDDTPWYPTARLFRQLKPGDWSAPLAEMALALRELGAASNASA